uniref:Uncharacterized protein n=1 Tax=Takifugu rubripes TaxID=31033 RepID=A0A3B5K324_TAKRU
VVKPSGPVDGDVCLLLIQLHSTNTRGGKCRRTLTSLHLLAVLRHVVRSDRAQEFDVIVAVVLGHLLSVSFVRTLKGDRRAIIEQEVVGHADSVGFHRMTLAIVIIPNVTWNKIKHQNDNRLLLTLARLALANVLGSQAAK